MLLLHWKIFIRKVHRVFGFRLLQRVLRLHFFFSFFFFTISTWTQTCQWISCTVHETHYHFQHPHISLKWHCQWIRALFMGPTNIFFTKILIKNEFHVTIHIFKNYFVIVFLAFNKISCIQMNPKSPNFTTFNKRVSH